MMRYKVNWFIPQQVLALTHFVSEVSQADLLEIVTRADALLQEAQQPFHMIIDNRIITSEQVASLESILEALPRIQQSPLQWMVMILPVKQQSLAASMAIQEMGTMRLKYADSLAAAFHHLRAVDDSIRWEAQDRDFFMAEDDSELLTPKL